MSKHEKTEVLVVGAGPVGMFTALSLAQRGVQVHLMDQESGPAGRSYACALHPSSVELLHEAGIGEEAGRLGFRIDRINYFQGTEQMLQLDLGWLTGQFPFILALPQSALEDLLEWRLKQMPNVRLLWRHRLQDLKMETEGVTALVQKLGFDGGGYGVPDFQLAVKKEMEVRADYIIGADGHASIVRQRIGIQPEWKGKPEWFGIYEIETERPLEPELNILLRPGLTHAMWPLGARRCRWSLQLEKVQRPEDFAEKDRSRLVMADASGPNSNRSRLETWLKERAPWFKAGINEVLWSTDIQFEHWLAAEFHRGRCFLAGDAAHQTGPIGMQSMNRGLCEAADIADRLEAVLRRGSNPKILASYDSKNRAPWQQMFEETSSIMPDENRSQIRATLPLTRSDIGKILEQCV